MKTAYCTCAIKWEGITLSKHLSGRECKSEKRPSPGAKNALKSAKTLVPFPTLLIRISLGTWATIFARITQEGPTYPVFYLPQFSIPYLLIPNSGFWKVVPSVLTYADKLTKLELMRSNCNGVGIAEMSNSANLVFAPDIVLGSEKSRSSWK